MNADHVSPEVPFVWWLLSSAVLAVGEYDSTGAVFSVEKVLDIWAGCYCVALSLAVYFLGSVEWTRRFGLVVGRCTHSTRMRFL